jgi:two-component sensor histidine kinase
MSPAKPCLHSFGRGLCNLAVLAPLLVLHSATPLDAAIFWSDPGARVVHHTDIGQDILGDAVKRDDTASDTLYFKFVVDPLSDVGTEEYFAGFQLFDGDMPRLAVGNAEEAWGYSAFNTSEMGPGNKVAGEFNLKSSNPEPSGLGVFFPYELPRHDVQRTLIFKVQYVPGGDDLITVWLSPDIHRGATDENQPAKLTTQFKADASFTQIRLRHGGNGNGWIFSGMTVASSFDDFIVQRFWQTLWFNALLVLVLISIVGVSVRFVEKRKFQKQLRLAEQASALERERSRIAQDLHDDLGSILTRISLLSGLLRADKDNPDQVELHATKLAESADQTVRSLEEIVWAVRPGSDTLQSLVEYIAHFAQETFESDKTRCRLDLPEDLPDRPLPPDMRHNIFLIAKEALTNALKHSGADEVRVLARVEGGALHIVIEDDGRGFQPVADPAPGRRNGLGNMQRRADAIGAKINITSEPGQGTRVTLLVNFPPSK